MGVKKCPLSPALRFTAEVHVLKGQISKRKADTFTYQVLCEKEVKTLKIQANLCIFMTVMQKCDRNVTGSTQG